MTAIKSVSEKINPAPSTARTDARVTFPDGSVYSAPSGTPLLDYVNAAYPPDHPGRPIVAAVVDNDLRELTFTVQRDAGVRPLGLGDSDGSRIYRRSLTFLLITAARELFPAVRVNVEHSLPTGGVHCSVEGREKFTGAELNQIRDRMRAIVAEDAPIIRNTLPLADAIALFESRQDDDKVRLLQFRTKNYLTVYTLHDNVDYFFGYMVATTGGLGLFELQSTPDGFIMLYPQRDVSAKIVPYKESPQLEAVFHETRDWLEIIQVEDVGRLNQSIAEGYIRDEILVAEALHSRRIAELAQRIADQRKKGVRLVLIAGPSSSGKTTFSKRLAVQLMAHSIKPFTLGMDNYFLDREKTPRDETGAFDFERLEALNLERLNADVLKLMQGEEVQMPLFDFKLGKSLPGNVAQLTDSHIIIAEGIHGLNPDLVPHIPPERIFRIYVSALTVLNLDRHNRIPTTDVRLLRRIVRDAAHRGYSAQDTLDRWESVRRGEKRNIFPYQENADEMFNTSLFYELAVIRPLAEPLLLQVGPDSPRYVEAKRLMAFLGWVRSTNANFVPGDSLLREFIGNSVLETYMPGVRQTNGLNNNKNNNKN